MRVFSIVMDKYKSKCSRNALIAVNLRRIDWPVELTLSGLQLGKKRGCPRERPAGKNPKPTCEIRKLQFGGDRETTRGLGDQREKKNELFCSLKMKTLRDGGMKRRQSGGGEEVRRTEE